MLPLYIANLTLFTHHISIVRLSFHQQAIAQGNSEGARIYAQDAIREKNQVSLKEFEYECVCVFFTIKVAVLNIK